MTPEEIEEIRERLHDAEYRVPEAAVIGSLLTALEEAEARVEERNELIEELSMDLYYEIRHRYRVGKDDEIHPALMGKWARDMDVVIRAREAVGLPELEEDRRALEREER